MGFWDWFRGKNKRTTSVDRIWMTKAAHRLGLEKELLAAVRPVLLLAHFPATLSEIGTDLEQQGIELNFLGTTITAPEIDRLAEQSKERIIYAGLVRHLQVNPFPEAVEEGAGLIE